MPMAARQFLDKMIERGFVIEMYDGKLRFTPETHGVKMTADERQYIRQNKNYLVLVAQSDFEDEIDLLLWDDNPPWWWLEISSNSQTRHSVTELFTHIGFHLEHAYPEFEPDESNRDGLRKIMDECLRLCKNGVNVSAIMERAEGLASSLFRLGATAQQGC